MLNTSKRPPNRDYSSDLMIISSLYMLVLLMSYSVVISSQSVTFASYSEYFFHIFYRMSAKMHNKKDRHIVPVLHNLIKLLCNYYAVIVVPVFPTRPSLAFSRLAITAFLSLSAVTNLIEASTLGKVVTAGKCPSLIYW